ncbi:formylglycine-generating enzyme family protein, partial [bacterium]|nr:formylglycine-generating enzyme family protein [bacterium]
MRFVFLFIIFTHFVSARNDYFEGFERSEIVIPIEEPFNSVYVSKFNPFILVQSGTFYMGSHPGYKKEDQHLARKVRMVTWNSKTGRKIHSEMFYPKLREKTEIKEDFELGKYEVTQIFFKNFMGFNPSQFKGELRPVENLSRQQINLFLKKLNALNDKYHYRLPTQIEWEYAYRAGEKDTFFFQNLSNYRDYMDVDLKRNPMIGLAVFGWLKGNTSRLKILKKQGGMYLGQTQMIGLKPVNAWGFHDMVGNVSERTSSIFQLPNDVHWLDSSGKKSKKNSRGEIAMGGSYKDIASIYSR